jgi:nitrile hydratase
MTNSIHDMGGMHGFGPIEAEPNEPPFHECWEGRVFAMQRAMGFTGLWTIDGGRASLEALSPLDYLASSYYRRWFLGLENRLLRYGLVGADEIAAGRSLRAGANLPRKLTAADVEKTMVRGEFARPTNQTARFKEGDRVAPRTSTRLRIPDCRAMLAPGSGRSRQSAAATCFPTPPPSARASTRNGSTR